LVDGRGDGVSDATFLQPLPVREMVAGITLRFWEVATIDNDTVVARRGTVNLRVLVSRKSRPRAQPLSVRETAKGISFWEAVTINSGAAAAGHSILRARARAHSNNKSMLLEQNSCLWLVSQCCEEPNTGSSAPSIDTVGSTPGQVTLEETSGKTRAGCQYCFLTKSKML